MTRLPQRRPFRPTLRSLERKLNDTIERFLEAENGTSDSSAQPWSPQMDVRETEDEYRLQIDLPGVSKEDVTISADDDRLTVRGERTFEAEEETGNVIRRERAQGHFTRTVSLPDAANVEDAKATFQDGTLTIQVPKAEEHSSRRIPIS